MKKFVSKLLIFALTLTAAVSLFAFAGCSSDTVRLNTSDKVAVTYDPLGGIWATGLSPEPKTFYAYEGSLLLNAYQKGGELENSFPAVRHNGYTLLGWYRSYEDETFQPDALGTYVKYAFAEDAAGTYKLDLVYTEDPDGNFIAINGEEGVYESYEDGVEYSSADYVGKIVDGTWTITRYVKYDVYSEYVEAEGEDKPEKLYKHIDGDGDEAFVVYQEKNPAHEGLQRYEAYYTFSESQKWDFNKDKVGSTPITLYARWKRSNTVLYLDGDRIYSSWIDGQKGAKIASGESIPQTQNVPMRDDATFVGWYKDKNFTEKWNFATDVFPSDTEVVTLYARFLEGEWTTVATKTQLSKVKDNPAGNYILTANIDCGGDNNPLGLANNTAFTGKFDGNGYKIYNFTINSSKQDTNYGLFRILNGASITNLTCEYTASLNKVNSANEICFGAVAGAVKGEKSVVTNCKFNVTVKDVDKTEKFHSGNVVGGKLNSSNAYQGAAGDLIEATGNDIQIKYPS